MTGQRISRLPSSFFDYWTSCCINFSSFRCVWTFVFIVSYTVTINGIKDQSFAANTIAADTKGRLWVVWAQHAPGRDRVYVRRSNTGATAFGPARYYVVPNGYQSVYHLAAAVRSGATSRVQPKRSGARRS